MSADPRIASLLKNDPVLLELPAPTREESLAAVVWLDLPEETRVFDESSACAGFPLVVRGAMRVSKCLPSGTGPG